MSYWKTFKVIKVVAEIISEEKNLKKNTDLTEISKLFLNYVLGCALSYNGKWKIGCATIISLQ